MIYSFVKFSKDGETVQRVFSFDVIQSFSESWSASVSKSTVESGFPIADNITVENPVFNISGILSSYSIFDNTKEIVWDGEDFVQGQSNVDLLRHITLRNDLKALFLERDFFTLLESEKNSFTGEDRERLDAMKSGYSQSYKNCVLTNFSIDYSDTSQDVVFVKLVVEQLNIARVITTALSDAQMTPRLVALKKEVVNKPSTTTSSDATKGDPIKDGVTGATGVTGSNGEKPTDGSSMVKSLNKRLDEDIIRADYESKVIAQAEKATEITGNPYVVIPEGFGYRVVVRK